MRFHENLLFSDHAALTEGGEETEEVGDSKQGVCCEPSGKQKELAFCLSVCVSLSVSFCMTVCLCLSISLSLPLSLCVSQQMNAISQVILNGALCHKSGCLRKNDGDPVLCAVCKRHVGTAADAEGKLERLTQLVLHLKCKAGGVFLLRANQRDAVLKRFAAAFKCLR